MNGAVTLDAALDAIRRHRDSARERGVELIGVIGSLARGEARDDSDVDVFAEYLRGTTLFRIGAVLVELEQDLGKAVDLIDRKNLDADMRARMERDLVLA